MANLPQVMLLGNSVLMDSVANHLAEMRFINVVRLNAESYEFDQLILTPQPVMIVYEYDPRYAHLMHSLLSKQPGPMLVGIDLSTSQVIVLDSQLRPTKSMEELCDLIQEKVQRCAQRKEVQ